MDGEDAENERGPHQTVLAANATPLSKRVADLWLHKGECEEVDEYHDEVDEESDLEDDKISLVNVCVRVVVVLMEEFIRVVIDVIFSCGIRGRVLVAVRVFEQLLSFLVTIEIISDVVERPAKVLTFCGFVTLTFDVPAVPFSDHNIDSESFSY